MTKLREQLCPPRLRLSRAADLGHEETESGAFYESEYGESTCS